ncbi:MAG: hypothetical protein EAY75_02635 [Bacteroidetes bacterium]|nr:MAG: hypothetical protein EAY75_02635 [Bacteroidota bacterium]
MYKLMGKTQPQPLGPTALGYAGLYKALPKKSQGWPLQRHVPWSVCVTVEHILLRLQHFHMVCV